MNSITEISPLTSFMAKSLDTKHMEKAKKYWIDYAKFTFTKMYEENFLEQHHLTHIITYTKSEAKIRCTNIKINIE